MINNPTVIEVNNLGKRFNLSFHNSLKERIVNFARFRANRNTLEVLHEINLQIHLGESVGLVGHNGSGKSTLLKILGGILEPTSGKVLTRGRMAALLELGTGFHPDLTGRENIFLNAALLGMSKQETQLKLQEIIDFSGVGQFIDTQVKFYSSGMYVRLAFSVAVHSDPDILLVDEVLAVGDEPFQLKCLEKIRAFQSEGGTIIFVSHSADQIIDVCSRVIVLDEGRAVFDGLPKPGIKYLREIYKKRN